MGFVDADALGFRWARVFEDVSLVLWRVPEHTIVNGGEVEVLRDSSDPCRYSLNTLVRCRYDQGDLGMGQWL